MTDVERYLQATHAMQSGVAAEMTGIHADACSPKHLLVGVNSALVNDAALVALLVSKGIITYEEYVKAVADEMEREVIRYEERLSAERGMRVTLG